MIWRIQIWSYHGSAADWLTVVALNTNAAPMNMSAASAASCSRSSLRRCSLMDGSTILICLRQNSWRSRRVFFFQNLRVNIVRDWRADRAAGTDGTVRLNHDNDGVTRIFIRRERGEPVIMADNLV